MSLKAARGTKRVCQGCGAKFYDLNRTPIHCPICQAVFQQEHQAKIAPVSNAADDEDDVVISRPGDVTLGALADPAIVDGDLPDLEDAELVDLGDDDAGLKDDVDEPFIEEEDDAGDDVSGLLSTTRESDEEV